MTATVTYPRLPPSEDLAHLPGENGLPLIGNTFSFIRDSRKLQMDLYKKYGYVARTKSFGRDSIGLLGPDANELLLVNKGNTFSSRGGWNNNLKAFFNRGLMLLDFDEHKFHRRIMQTAFRKEAMQFYVDGMNATVQESLEGWQKIPKFECYAEVKKMALDNAIRVFIGIEPGAEADKVNKAFVDSVNATIAFFRYPLIGTNYRKGVVGRQYLERFFDERIEERKQSNGSDMFTQFCHATDEQGQQFSNTDITNHMIFLLMAAHDTITSSMTTLLYELARNPQWQQQLREGCQAVNKDSLGYHDMEIMPEIDWSFDEALRLHTPVPYIPRQVMHDVEFKGYKIPRGSAVSTSPDFTHRMPEYWKDPDAFDPERFSPHRAEHKQHRYLFVPYGGGAHKCIGMHFAQIMAKVFVYQFLLKFQCSLHSNADIDIQHVPIPRPKRKLYMCLDPLS